MSDEKPKYQAVFGIPEEVVTDIGNYLVRHVLNTLDPRFSNFDELLASMDEKTINRIASIDEKIGSLAKLTTEALNRPIMVGEGGSSGSGEEAQNLFIMRRELLLPKHTERYELLRGRLGQFAKIESSSSDMLKYRLTKMSLWNAASQDFTPNELIDLLKTNSKSPPDKSLQGWISRIMSQWGCFQIVAMQDSKKKWFNALEAVDSTMMDQVTAIPEIKQYLYRRIDEKTHRIVSDKRFLLKQILVQKGYPVLDYGIFSEIPPVHNFKFRHDTVQARPYQDEAVKRFKKRKNGSIIMPPGAGKTIVGVRISAELEATTLVLTHRAEIAEQFKQAYLDHTTLKPHQIGVIYHGSPTRTIKPVTITTYQTLTTSSMKGAVKDIWGTKWKLIIFDECLPYASEVLLADGSSRKIGDIVESEVPCEVMAYNHETGCLEPKRVTGYYKIPLYRKLMKIHHEYGTLVCTEDHQIFTQRGYAASSSIIPDDFIYISNDILRRNDLYMQSLWQSIPDSPCVRRSYPIGSQLEVSGESQGSVETDTKRPNHPSPKTKECGDRENQDSFRDSINPISTTDDLGRDVRRSQYLQKEASVESSPFSKSYFQTSRVRYVEILPVEEYGSYTTKDMQKWGLGQGVDTVRQYEPTLSERDIRPVHSRGSQDCDPRMARSDNPGGVSDLAHGRRIIPSKGTQHQNQFTQLHGGRKPLDEKLVHVSMGHRSHSQLQQGMVSEDEPRSLAEVLGVSNPDDFTSAFNDVQNYVYDIEVEDHHNFVADGVLVHNCQFIVADKWRTTAEGLQTSMKLGLTATLVREDKREAEIFSLIGPEIMNLNWLEVEDEGYIASLKLVEVLVDLPNGLRRPYNNMTNWNQVKTATGNPNKVKAVKRLIERHKDENILIMSQYVAVAEKIGDELGILVVSGQMNPKKRHEIYDQYRNGEINRLILTSVGEVGINLPSATVGINVSGQYGSRMSFSQRSGRVLRPAEGKKAIFYEIVSAGTVEQDHSERRRAYLEAQGYTFDQLDWAGKL